MSYRDKTPQIISILTRRLKPGKTFEDFQQAHLPPGKCTPTELGYDVDYFPIPTRVLNMISLTDPSIIVSVGLSYGATSEEIFKAVQEKMPIEHERAKKIETVSEKAGPTQLFAVATDNNYGDRNPDYPQGPLIPVTPELIEVIGKFFAKPKS